MSFQQQESCVSNKRLKNSPLLFSKNLNVRLTFVARATEREKRNMNYQHKLDTVRSIFEQHNSQPDGDKLDFDEFVLKLKRAGGTTDEALRLSSWEDIESLGLPRLLARQVANTFRKSDEKERSKPLTEKRVSLMNVRELLEVFEPKYGDTTLVGARLNQIAKGEAFLVFNDNGCLDIEASRECLEDIRLNNPLRDIYIGSDMLPRKIYSVGQHVDTTLNENPLFPGRALRGDNDLCDRTHRAWKDVPHKARVVLSLALKLTQEVAIRQLSDVHDILDKFIGKSEEEILSLVAVRHPRAMLKYKELEVLGQLPTLRILRSDMTGSKQDPFFKHKTY